MPVLVVALVVAAAIALAAYWPFPRPSTTAPLTAAVEIDRSSGPHPLSVSVTANVTGGVAPYSYEWSFGDGTVASAASTTHLYGTRGAYQILLRVSDRDNHTAGAGASVRVDPDRARTGVANATGQALGPGGTNAWVFPLPIPSTAVSAWVNGTSTVTACSLGGNCAAFVEILSADDEANLTHGKAVTNPIWCLVVTGACGANQTTAVSVNLAAQAGTTDYLVIYNTDIVWSQTVSAMFSMDCWY